MKKSDKIAKIFDELTNIRDRLDKLATKKDHHLIEAVDYLAFVLAYLEEWENLQ